MEGLLRQRTAKWFECKIRYEKVQEDGLSKKVSEVYTIDALSFSEAEARIIDEMSAYISGSFDVDDIKKAKYGEIFFDDSDSADKWFKATLSFITIDEKTEREKRSNHNYLVQGASYDDAKKNIEKVMGDTMIDYEIKSLSETNIFDVFEYVKGKNEKVDVEVTEGKLEQYKGCLLAEKAVKVWTEDFVDEDKGEVVPVERKEIVLERLAALTEENIKVLLASGIEKVQIFKDRRK